MKSKVLKIILAVCVIFLLLGSFAGCEMKKYYSHNGVTIRLPDSFERKAYPNTAIYLFNDDVGIAVIPEQTPTIDIESMLEKYSAEDYAKFVAATVEGSSTGFADEIPFVEYEYSHNDKRYFSMAFLFKTSSTFFKAQFECEADKKGEYREKFMAWANTITFGEQ